MYDEVRAALVEISRRLLADRLCVGTAGNASVRVGEHIAITPSGVPPEELSPADIAVLSLDGEPVELTRPASSELALHATVYAATRAAAVVHTHSPCATALSTVLDELPAVHYTITALGGPVPVVPYATFGTTALADGVRAALGGRVAVLLANHGALTYAPTLQQAYSRAVLLEWLAEVYWRAVQLGEPRILSPAQLDAVREQARRLRDERPPG